MSVSTNVFVLGNITLDAVLHCLENILGHRFQNESSVQGNLYKTSVMGIEIAVFDNHGLVADAGIDFEKYPFEISFVLFAGLPEEEMLLEFCPLFALLCARMLSRTLKCECLVTANLQRVIAQVVPH
jgi:hypothetical protein